MSRKFSVAMVTASSQASSSPSGSGGRDPKISLAPHTSSQVFLLLHRTSTEQDPALRTWWQQSEEGWPPQAASIQPLWLSSLFTHRCPDGICLPGPPPQEPGPEGMSEIGCSQTALVLMLQAGTGRQNPKNTLLLHFALQNLELFKTPHGPQ